MTISLKIDVISFEDEYISNENANITFYKVNVLESSSERTYSLRKRFSELHALCVVLISKYDSLKHLALPSKSFFRVSTDDLVTKEKRRLGFDTFMKNMLILISNHDDILKLITSSNSGF